MKILQTRTHSQETAMAGQAGVLTAARQEELAKITEAIHFRFVLRGIDGGSCPCSICKKTTSVFWEANAIWQFGKEGRTWLPSLCLYCVEKHGPKNSVLLGVKSYVKKHLKYHEGDDGNFDEGDKNGLIYYGALVEQFEGGLFDPPMVIPPVMGGLKDSGSKDDCRQPAPLLAMCAGAN